MVFYEDIIVTTDNKVQCKLCEESIQDQETLIEAHFNTIVHKKLYMKRLMARNGVIIKKSSLFCSVCHSEVETSELVQHINGTAHHNVIKTIQEIIIQDGGLIELADAKKHSESSVQCIICNNKLEFTLSSIKDHILSQIHRRAKAMVIQPLNGIFSVDDENYLWCKLCQVFFDNYVEVIFEHIENNTHAKELNKIIGLIGDDIDIEKYLQCLSEDKAFCKKCNIEVPCGVDNLQRHIGGKRHNS